MSTSSFSTTHDDDSFVCECHEYLQGACVGEVFYKEHDGKPYCVLHYPGIEKKEDFKKVLERKISEGDFDFKGVWFPDGVSFNHFTFSAAADFTRAQFSADASFTGAKFSAAVSFFGAQFSAAASFSYAQFSANAIFDNAQFSTKADFFDVQFSANASFLGGKFNADANFFRVQFNADAEFFGAKFGADANFTGAKFSARVMFADAQYSADANFDFANFSAGAYFSDAVFNGNANFHRTTFIEKDDSLGKSVNGNNKAISTDDGDGAKTNIEVFFDKARFKDSVSFEGNEFACHALLSFDAVGFETPERVTFHTVALRPNWFVNVDSSKLNFINVDWERLNRWDAVRKEINELELRPIARTPRLLAITLRQLAVNAEENNRYEEAASFRYMAMEVKRLERRYIENLFSLSFWYWALSGYGERVQRAFGALLTIWLLFAFIYWSGNATWWQPKQYGRLVLESTNREKQPTIASTPLTFPEALIYSAGVMTLQKPEPPPANKRAKAFILFETILGPLQAALLALAIRRKFMR
jgi:hypothetical protein